MLETVNLHAGYGKEEILHGASLECPSGKITTLIGANGCGKSTLLKTVLGMLPVTGGEIIADGVSTQTLSPSESAKRIAYVAQGKNIPDITVGRMVLHGRFPYLSYPRRYAKADFEAAQNAMEQMGISQLADKLMSELSGGMRQKVYIAMALCQQADIILMDEPTTYLDIGQQLKLADSVRQLAESGKTVLLVLHDILLALKISDRIAVMENGVISQTGTPEEILASDILSKIYGVGVKTLNTPDGTEYYYERSL